MRIQIVSSDNYGQMKENGMCVSSLSNPISLDEFDVNVIDLSTPSLWRSKQTAPISVNQISDLISICQMVEKRSTSKILYILPPNCAFSYHYSEYCKRDNGYQKKVPIKDCLSCVVDVLSKALPFAVMPASIIFENTTTVVGDIPYSASFYFEGFPAITRSNKSEKNTTIDFGGFAIVTALQVLESPDKLVNFLKFIFPPAECEPTPPWAKEIKILNDTELSTRIEKANEDIRQLEKMIDVADKGLQENARIKSILYTSGDELVDVVFLILEKILSCDLSQFEDEKREDFRIEKGSYTLIGEIKGVSSNIKNEHISQVDVHYQVYLDNLSEQERQEEVYQVLIINPFRNKPLTEREPVHETQIKLAERNKCLIIETITLLKLYERFVAGKISVSECEKLFKERIGLLRETDFC